jgi:hypothetical protein
LLTGGIQAYWPVGRMHRDYIKEHNPIRFNDLCLSGELWTYLADLNEQAQSRLELIIGQIKAAEGVTERMKQYKDDQRALDIAEYKLKRAINRINTANIKL